VEASVDGHAEIGENEGEVVARAEGAVLGKYIGVVVLGNWIFGAAVGTLVGPSVVDGKYVGLEEGEAVGDLEGLALGVLDVGLDEGEAVGVAEGEMDGVLVGTVEGAVLLGL
jgi:hypothetical protein